MKLVSKRFLIVQIYGGKVKELLGRKLKHEYTGVRGIKIRVMQVKVILLNVICISGF